MDLEIIKTVLDVARLKSFSAAAYCVPCSQSSVSRRVEAAENELGCRIFHRPSELSGRTVELTEVGAEVVRAMTRVVEAYEDMFAAACEDSVASLNLGVRNFLMPPMGISRMKADFFSENPRRSLNTHMDRFSNLLSEFRMRRLDAVLFFSKNPTPGNMHLEAGEEMVLLGSADICVGLPVRHPLAQRQAVRIAELQEEVFLLGNASDRPSAGVRFAPQERFVDLCAAKGVELKYRILPADMLDIRYDLAAAGKGIFPSYTPEPWRQVEGLCYVRVEDINPQVNYYLLRSPGRKDKDVDAFCRFFSRRLVLGSQREGML